MDFLVAIDTLDDAVHNAKAVPLTDQVRMPPDELRRLVDDVKALAEADPRWGPEVHAQIARFDPILAGAKKMFLTNDVRVDKEALFDVLDGVRLAVVENGRGAG